MTFTTGYAATSQAIEQPILHAIMMMTAGFYENRGDVDAEVGITLTMKRLLSQYRIQYWA